MKEKIENRRIDGTIRITLKDLGKVWVADKETLCNQIVSVVNDIYHTQGYRLTLRQLYYQLVSKDYIPNHDKVYKKLSGVLDDLRYNGMVDWRAFEDRGRVPFMPYYDDSVKSAIDDTIARFRLQRQKGQPTHVEVWTEKDAISGIIKPVVAKYGIRLMINKGYSSSTAMHSAYDRFVGILNSGRKVKIIYFGDHDPSGLDMVRDIEERIKNFLLNGDQLDDWWIRENYDKEDEFGYHIDAYPEHTGLHDYWTFDDDGYPDRFLWGKWLLEEKKAFEVVHAGLTRDQIRELNPPPNPAKVSDPRAGEYVRRHGRVSWEVDALQPADIVRIITEEVEETIDMGIYEDVLSQESEDKEKLKNLFPDENQDDEIED